MTLQRGRAIVSTSGGSHAAAWSGAELQLPNRRKERTPPEVREQRERERELRELDRDIRTVFAFNLPLKADERNLFEFFSKAGQVEDVRIIKDRNTNKSKGFAYIEYTNRVRPDKTTTCKRSCLPTACALLPWQAEFCMSHCCVTVVDAEVDLSCYRACTAGEQGKMP